MRTRVRIKNNNLLSSDFACLFIFSYISPYKTKKTYKKNTLIDLNFYKAILFITLIPSKLPSPLRSKAL